MPNIKNEKLIVQHRVYAEVESAWLWYENIVPGLGDQFLDDWESILHHVEKYPEHFSKKNKNFRFAPLERFPFLICFVIEPTAVVVYGLIHVKKKPSKRYRKR